MATTLSIGQRLIGTDQPCFIIAEAGVNHNGNIDLARRLIDVAVDAGADAVKFQTFKAEQLVTAEAPKAEYQQRTTDRNESQFDMLKHLELDFDSFRELYAYCQSKNILFLSTPFDEDSADFLETLGVAAFKIPSGEITNLPYLTHIARNGRPMIVSTGMAYLSEVETAVRAIRATGNNEIALLHCASSYPADPGDINLRAMSTLSSAFGVPIGFSDHTQGLEIPLAAVALGASIIEKHFTLDRTLPGPDHAASLEPDQLTALTRGIRNVEAALGHGRKEPAASEANTAAAARRSLVAARDLPAGTVLTEADLAIKRPGTGLAPALRSHLIGRVTRVKIPGGTLLSLEMLT
jgi:N,N'-diacetyllegionaminate synthase